VNLEAVEAVAAGRLAHDMGAQGYLIASALDGILAQRLVRRVCDNCAHAVPLTVQQRTWLSRFLTQEAIDEARFVEGAGCTYCNMTGYRGRVGIYELLEVDSSLADAMRRGDMAELERRAARSPGFVPLAERAIHCAREGVTSVVEVMSTMAGLEEPDGQSLLDDVLASAGAAAEPAPGEVRAAS
jgi:MSHA biogenesis protein MshE